MSIISSFWKESTVYGLSTILVRAVSFLLLPIYTTYFTIEEAGYVYLLFTFIAFVQVIYSHGMDSSFLKFIAPKNSKSRYIISTTFVGLFFTSSISSSLDKILIFFIVKKEITGKNIKIVIEICTQRSRQ